ncbi:membrane protein, putative [Listeria marthii FSL S4-120]|uniref:Membrane protein, putative n=1 Tax=Listeria marthii FSL S4-120 TaxID=702457 RepID=A0ABN0BTK4_9LIST|nr:membrane protein, putative [Listeria marthii FSL S4-120]
MKLTNILFNKEIIQKISFNQANQVINKTIIEKTMNQKMLLLRYIIFAIIISIEILLASTFSGWVVSSPVFALIEWVVVLVTIIYFFKINLKSFSENYLSRFYSCCSIIFSIISVIFSLGLWFVFGAFSAGIKDEYMAQIVIQTISAVGGVTLVSFAIYKYLQYLEINELADFDSTIKIPLWGKIVDKSLIYGVVIVIAGMQIYRMNKFWLLNDDSWISTMLVPLGQILLVAIVVFLLVAIPVRFFYPDFVKSYLLQKYTEAFRKEHGFTEKQWYSE